jgi:hypothetical protein
VLQKRWEEILEGFKLICCKCGSDKVIEKSAKNKLDYIEEHIKYGEGIERKCLDCSNEAFIVYRTWLE